MRYDREIFGILSEAGSDGLSVGKISRHVYNACNTLFAPVEFETVHRYVAQYLIRNSRNPDSVIEKCSLRGVYRLNMKSVQTMQLMLEFGECKDETKAKDEQKDYSLSLFDE